MRNNTVSLGFLVWNFGFFFTFCKLFGFWNPQERVLKGVFVCVCVRVFVWVCEKAIFDV